MPQSKEVHKEYMRKRRQGSQNTGEGSQYPAVIHALADLEKRAKLRAICDTLKHRGLLREVRYGVSGPSMDVVAELYEVTSS